MAAPPDLERQIAVAIDAATRGAWRLGRSWQERGCVCIAVDVTERAHGTLPALVLEVRKTNPDTRSYRTIQSLAFAYRGSDLPDDARGFLDESVAALATLLVRARFDPSVDTLPVSARESLPIFPTPFHRSYLESVADLAPGQIADYRRDGHVLIRRAIAPDIIVAARPYLESALRRAWPTNLPPVEERRDAYSQSFTQITDLGHADPAVRAFSWAHRIASMAATLMGVHGVRIFCEDWLIKEPGARITPWHQDEAVFPFDAPATITCWIPLRAVRRGEGLLRFVRGSHRSGVAAIEDISDVSEAAFSKIISEGGFAVDELPPVSVGDVSFHDGRMIHGAFANDSAEERGALAIHFFADGARMKAPTTPRMAAIFEGSAPGLLPGDLAATDSWPLVYAAGTDALHVLAREPAKTFHLRATPLPHGTSPIDLWIAEGRFRLSPIEGATELAAPGAFVSSGLVDCHGHISYPHERGVPVESTLWMNERRAEYAVTGVLVIRDMGAVDDAISSLVDVPGLPRVHAAGNMILRYDEFPFTRTEPQDLVRACIERVERGARWTKIFADWTSDYRGRVNSGFSDDDAVTYPLAMLSEAVVAVHERGGRVAAHCFTRAGAEVAIRAGVDSIEHGWGLDEGLVEQMAAGGIAWAPLVGIAGPMWQIARRDSEPDRARWVECTMSSLERLLPLADARGVTLLAGTDMFPDVTVGDEIRQLHALGLAITTALGAGMWVARAWLGEPGIEEGAPADLVLHRSDPRRDLDALFRPEVIMLGGERVEPSFAHVRSSFVEWHKRDCAETKGHGCA